MNIKQQWSDFVLFNRMLIGTPIFVIGCWILGISPTQKIDEIKEDMIKTRQDLAALDKDIEEALEEWNSLMKKNMDKAFKDLIEGIDKPKKV